MSYDSTNQFKKFNSSILSKVLLPLFVILFASITYSQNKIYWTQQLNAEGGKVMRANLDGANVEQLVAGLDDPQGIAIDPIQGKVYWTDKDTQKIQRANLDGSAVETLITITESGREPFGLALDLTNAKMYWITEALLGNNDLIFRANLDGSGIEQLVPSSSLSTPKWLDLDIPGGKMYWTDGGSDKVQRSDLDGTNIEDLISQTNLVNSLEPRGIALDLLAGKLYWVNSSAAVNSDKILRSNLDGTSTEILVTFSSRLRVPDGLVLDIIGGKIYWTELNQRKIQRANLDGSQIEDIYAAGVFPHDIEIARVPDAPILAGPTNGSTELNTSLTLSWSAVENTTSYQLQVATDPNFSQLVIDQSGLTNLQSVVSELTKCTEYYWRVRAINAVGSGAWSDEWIFTTIKVQPTATTLVSPSDGETTVQTDPTLIWNSSFCADSYQLEVSTDSNFSTLVVDQSGITDTSFSVSPLSEGTSYYWRVNANNNVGTSDWSNTSTFTTILVAPAVPSLVSPADSETGVATAPTLVWNASNQASSYQLQVSTTVSFSTTVIDQSDIAATTFSVSALTNNTTYFWRVNATNEGGTSDWSSIWQFTTIVAAPAAPTLASPSDGSTGIPTNATLSWNASSGATSYNFQVATSPSFSKPTTDQNDITETSFSIDGLLNNTDYFWRVSATNKGGTSDWSTIWQFTTIIAAPAAPILTSPADSATGISTNPTLVWNPSDDATSYGLQVSTLSDFQRW